MRIDGKSDVTIRNYVGAVRKFLNFIKKRCIDVTSNDVLLFVGTLQQKKELKSQSIYTLYKEIRCFFKWLEENEYIVHSPFGKLHYSDKTKPLKETLTPEDIVKLKDACKNNMFDLALIDFLVSTGVRVGELILLNISDVNFVNSSVSVYAPKTKTHRTVFLIPSSLKHLTDYLESRKDDSDILFSRREGKRMCDTSIEDRIHAVAKSAGINKHVTVHTFRRTLATTLHKKGMTDIDIAAILGHSDISTTVKYYIKNDVDNLRNSYSKYTS